MMIGDINSWNLRDTHMVETLEGLIDFHKKENNNKKSKAIVWAHNTHIGDARFTDMAQSGMINIGQLVREKKGIQNTVLVGFSTYSGTGIASEKWGTKMEIINVPPAREGSWDNILHNLNNDPDNIKKDKIIIFERDSAADKIISKEDNYINDKIYENRDQRAIGVIYNSKYEKYGNYVPTILSLRYDALLYIDSTNALNPLHIIPVEDKEPPETFPRGE